MTTQLNVTVDQAKPQGNLRRLLWVSPLTILITTIANLVFYAVMGSLFPEVRAWPGAGFGQIIGATIVYLLIATLIFAIIARRSARPARTYIIVATIGLLLSLALPISAAFGYTTPGAPLPGLATVIALCLMHVLSYAISVPMFIRLGLDGAV